ncbi:hypothetical protein ACFLXH_05065 [Chloroflexota bacterium]
MQVIGLILGLISIVGMFVFFLPLLGALNWLNIPLAIIGFIISLLSIIHAERKGIGIAGIILCSVAIVVGIGRLKIGCGIF